MKRLPCHCADVHLSSIVAADWLRPFFGGNMSEAVNELREIVKLLERRLESGELSKSQIAKLFAQMRSFVLAKRKQDRRPKQTKLEKIHKQLQQARELAQKHPFLQKKPEDLLLSPFTSIQLGRIDLEMIGLLAGMTERQLERLGLTRYAIRDLKNLFRDNGFLLGASLSNFQILQDDSS